MCLFVYLFVCLNTQGCLWSWISDILSQQDSRNGWVQSSVMDMLVPLQNPLGNGVIGGADRRAWITIHHPKIYGFDEEPCNIALTIFPNGFLFQNAKHSQFTEAFHWSLLHIFQNGNSKLMAFSCFLLSRLCDLQIHRTHYGFLLVTGRLWDLSFLESILQWPQRKQLFQIELFMQSSQPPLPAFLPPNSSSLFSHFSSWKGQRNDQYH